jgi:hypothetical protein
MPKKHLTALKTPRPTPRKGDFSISGVFVPYRLAEPSSAAEADVQFRSVTYGERHGTMKVASST